MKTQILERDEKRIIECVDELSRVDDALELVTACFEGGSRRLLIESRFLPDSFFDLSTRFAGEFLQKLQNYRIRTAVVVVLDIVETERFKEFLAEARRGSSFRVFEQREAAEDWLCTE